MQKAARVLALSILTACLAGCGQDNGTPEISSLSFGKEGEIQHNIVGKLDQNYYQASDLESFATERVEEYCADHGEKSVTLEAVEEKDGKVLLRFRYASPEDYSSFNHRILYIGSLEGAAAEGYELEAVPFVTTEGKATEVGYIEDWGAGQMIVLETRGGEEILVNLPGNTLYINQSAGSDQEVAFVGKKSVRISNQEGENGYSLSYIIYE